MPLRDVRGPDRPDTAAAHVLSVDDFEIRKGRIHGTILIDSVRRRIIGRLPDRESATLTDWLRPYPGVVVVSWDSASA